MTHVALTIRPVNDRDAHFVTGACDRARRRTRCFRGKRLAFPPGSSDAPLASHPPLPARPRPPRPLLGLAAVLIAGGLATRAVPARGEARAGDAAPEVEPASVVLFVDQGRLELTGQHLEGARLRWQARGSTGEDVCWTPKPVGRAQQCAFGVARGLDIDTSFDLFPPSVPAKGAAPPESARPPAPAASVRPARVVLDRVLPGAAAIDLTNGAGRIPLVHPEAVASVECGQARCELAAAAVQVGAVPGSATELTLRLRMAPRYFVLDRDDLPQAAMIRTVSVVHCQAAVISGLPPRHAESTRIIVRLDARCGAGARELQWTMNGEHVRMERAVTESGDRGAVDVQLGVGDIEDAQVTLMASRPEPDGSVIAVAHQETQPALQVHAALDLPGFGKIDFVPTNREAVLRTAPAGPNERLVPLPVEGAYRVRFADGKARVQAEEGAGGFVSLRFGYRVEGLPAAFAATNLAVVNEPLQRPIREASVPAPLATSLSGAAPLLELLCADAQGAPRAHPARRRDLDPLRPARQLPPGHPPRAPRAPGRHAGHRRRRRHHQGRRQPRADAHQLERMVLRAGQAPRTSGSTASRRRSIGSSLRVSHIIDEDARRGRQRPARQPAAAQWRWWSARRGSASTPPPPSPPGLPDHGAQRRADAELRRPVAPDLAGQARATRA